jgi:hypothetical protein
MQESIEYILWNQLCRFSSMYFEFLIFALQYLFYCLMHIIITAFWNFGSRYSFTIFTFVGMAKIFKRRLSSFIFL